MTTHHTMSAAALDLARTRAKADVGALARVAGIFRRRGQTSEARFWSEAAKTSSVLAELGRRYLARAGDELTRHGGLLAGVGRENANGGRPANRPPCLGTGEGG